jgi:hypothetical protein
LKIELLDLEFNSEYFYIQKKSIVEKVTFNNRTFYSKFEKYKMPISFDLLQEHKNNGISLAVPLVEENFVNYIVIEYQQDDWNVFYSLLKHLLKSLDIVDFQAYINTDKELFQLFIPRDKMGLDIVYKEVENIKHLLELKSKKSYKIYPNKNLPKNFNIITLPTQKI